MGVSIPIPTVVDQKEREERIANIENSRQGSTQIPVPTSEELGLVEGFEGPKSFEKSIVVDGQKGTNKAESFESSEDSNNAEDIAEGSLDITDIMGDMLNPDTSSSGLPFCIYCGGSGLTVKGEKCKCGRKPNTEVINKTDFAPEFFVPEPYRTNFWTKEKALKNPFKQRLGVSDVIIDYKYNLWVGKLNKILEDVRDGKIIGNDYFIAAPDNFGKKRWLYTLIHSMYIRGFMTSQVLILDDVREESAEIISPLPLILIIPYSHKFRYNLGLLEYILQKRRLFGYHTIMVTNIKTIGFERDIDRTIMDLGVNLSIYERGDILYGRTIEAIENENTINGRRIETTIY